MNYASVNLLSLKTLIPVLANLDTIVFGVSILPESKFGNYGCAKCFG